MSRAAEMKRMLDPVRREGESRQAYVERRRFGNMVVKKHVAGRVAVPAPRTTLVSPAGVDDALDRAIEAGLLKVIGTQPQFYDCVRVDLPGLPVQTRSRMLRVVRECGTPYVKEEKADV